MSAPLVNGRPTRCQALNAAKEANKFLPDGFWMAVHPKCPHCGATCPVDECELWELYEEGEHDVECLHCGLEFQVLTHITHSFSTDEQPDELDRKNG